MTTTTNGLRATARLAILLSSLLALTACERDNPTPPDAGGRRDAGSDAGDGLTDAGPSDGGVDIDADVSDCLGDDGCWSCPPTESIHFLNACTDGTCFPFPVNTTRLPRLRADGTVPPLP